MSEEPEFEYDNSADDAAFFGFVADDPEVRVGSSVPQPGPADAVTRRFFDEDGSPRSELTADAGEAIWNAYANGLEEQFEAEAAVLNPAVDYTSPEQSWAEDEFDARVQSDAQMQASAQAFGEALVGLVREVAASSEFRVRDEDAIGRVAAGVEAWRKANFDRWMANGAIVNQGLAALRDLDVRPAVRELLAGEKYYATTNTGELAEWRHKQAGQAPRRNVGHQSLERMARAMDGHAARVAQQRQ